jgi:hypothetical protein
MRFKRFFSVDSPKAIKAGKYGYLNAINYMAPAKSAGVGNLCSHATGPCVLLCLGRESGQASMVSAATNWTNPVRDSRERKARYLMRERIACLTEMLRHIANLCRMSRRKRLKLAIRPNGSTDIAWEGLHVMVWPALAAELSKVSGHKVTAGLHTIFSAFPRVQFVDYSKNPNRFARQLPPNYYLTFSRSESNEPDALRLLAAGHNVAVVFASRPETWHGYPVIDGDLHDLRHLDPKGVVVGLSPKGYKARRDMSGFVVRAT